MKKHIALTTVMWLSVAGMLFSGYLSYTELAKAQCAIGGGCTTLGPLPTCVYGFVMYTAVFVISILGLRSKK